MNRFAASSVLTVAEIILRSEKLRTKDILLNLPKWHYKQEQTIYINSVIAKRALTTNILYLEQHHAYLRSQLRRIYQLYRC